MANKFVYKNIFGGMKILWINIWWGMGWLGFILVFYGIFQVKVQKGVFDWFFFILA